MLTPDNIATLRRAVYRSQSRRADGRWAVVRFEGGPLDGIRLSVPQREAVSASMGFCTVTDTGPVQALYHVLRRLRGADATIAGAGRSGG